MGHSIIEDVILDIDAIMLLKIKNNNHWYKLLEWLRMISITVDSGHSYV